MKTHDLVKDFAAKDQDGNSVRLSGLLEGGPVVLFFFGEQDRVKCSPRSLSMLMRERISSAAHSHDHE